MKIGVVLPTMSRPGHAPGDAAQAARHAERLGFESAWAVDQLIAGTGVPLVDSVVALAAAAGRPVPAVTANAMLVLAGDETLPEPAEIARQIADPDGMFGFPAEAAAGAARVTGAAAAAAYLSRLEEAGAERAVVTFPAGDWYRQASLLAEAAGTVGAQKAG
jgi:Luciferase-like monooxygenase